MIRTPAKNAAAKRARVSGQGRSTSAKQAMVVSRVPRPLVVGNKGVLPLRLQNTMRYSTYVSGPTTGSAPNIAATLSVPVSDIYSPYSAGVSVLRFSDMCRFYRSWVVLRSKVTFTIVNSTGPSRAVAYLKGGGPIVSPSVAASVFGAKKKDLSVNFTDPVSLTVYYDAQRREGGNVIDNNELHGTNAASPSDTDTRAVITVLTPNSGDVVSFRIDMEYTVVWWDYVTSNI